MAMMRAGLLVLPYPADRPRELGHAVVLVRLQRTPGGPPVDHQGRRHLRAQVAGEQARGTYVRPYLVRPCVRSKKSTKLKATT